MKKEINETLKLALDLQEMSKKADKIDLNKKNIIRLKRRSIAELAEDRLAIYIYNMLNDKDVKIFINGKIGDIRPDIIIMKNNIVIGIIELKINFGWCRNIFDCEEDGKRKYKEISDIHDRFSKLEKIRAKNIVFNIGDDENKEGKNITISPQCKLLYVSTSMENYVKDRKMYQDFEYFIKKNPKYQNKVYFFIITEKYHFDRNKNEWPNEEEIKDSITKLASEEYSILKMFDYIK